MPVVINHSTLADGTFSAAGAMAWDANHTFSGLGTMAEQNSNSVTITGGSVDGTAIGNTTAAAGAFTTLAGNNTVTFSATTQTIALGTSQTTGLLTLGNTAGTGTITVGQSTVSQTTNIQAGVTASGSTKTINLGTGAASGATSTITIGSATSGAVQRTTVNGRVTFAPVGASVTAWTTTGVSIVQSAATFTDTSSTGTVSEIRMNNFAAQTLTATNVVTATTLIGTHFAAPVAGTNITATNLFALGTDSLRVSGTVLFSSTGSSINLGTSQSTGAFTIGGASQTGALIFGRSTVSQTTSIQAGATASGSTKTINFGTGGLSGSTTTITIGSTFGTTITLNAPIRMAPYTVATLPAAGTAGRRAYVTDALAPTFLTALVGGGAIVCPAFDNGVAWVAG